MRNLIVSIIMLLSISTASQASDNPNYKKFASYNNDSILYLKENFQNGEFYIGKTLKELLNDLELQIKCSHFGPDFFGDLKVHDAIVYFDEDNVVSKTIILEKRGKALLKMLLFFEPISLNEYENMNPW